MYYLPTIWCLRSVDNERTLVGRQEDSFSKLFLGKNPTGWATYFVPELKL